MSAPAKAQTPDAQAYDLWRVAETGNLEQLEELLARGADVNASNETGVTPLMVAAYHGRLEMVNALLEHRAKLNATDSDGFTAAMLADHAGHGAIVNALVARGVKKTPKASVPATPSFSDEQTLGNVGDSEEEMPQHNTEVRTLHEPPDIWNLVHETRAEFNPASAFISKITSRKYLTLIVIGLVVGGGAVFGFTRLKGWSVTQAIATAPTAPVAKTTLGASTRQVALKSSVEAPLQVKEVDKKSVSTSPVTEPPATSLSSNQQPIASADISGQKVYSEATTVAAISPLPDRRIVRKRRGENPVSSTAMGAPTVTHTDDANKIQSTASPKSEDAKSTKLTAAKKEEDKTPGTPMNTTPKASTTPKAKVIPWP